MVALIKSSTANGSVIAPPSKSMAHRLLICAALSGKKCKISNISLSNDISATIDCLNSLGANVEVIENTAYVGGVDFNNLPEEIIANCQESGSTLRFLIPIMLLTGKKCTFIGSEYLFSRPLTVYEEICQENNFHFEKGKDYLTVKGKLQSGVFEIQGNISSQFISGLLFALPLLKNDSKIIVKGLFESSSYVDLTVKAISDFGVDITKFENEYIIKGSQNYLPQDFSVEGDYSNAAFLEAFNILGGNVSVLGLSPSSLQGDRVYLDYFKLLKESNQTLDITNCPDLAPILFVVAALCHGATFTGTMRLKMKESDRAAVMKQELEKFGANIEVFENSVIIKKATLHSPTASLYSHNDHRIAMSLAVLASKYPGVICGAEAVNKSYPDFWQAISSLGIEVSQLLTDSQLPTLA